LLEGNKHRINNNSIQEVIVIVKDTGSGIDTEVVPKLFSKFAAKSDHRTGLGLFYDPLLFFNIIEAHGGKIWAKNNTGGKRGTTFSLP
jgi:two-component system, OmpR family, sensor histidine kinase VicK